MAKYLLIESRDPFDSRDCRWFYSTASQLSKAGNQVILFFVQNGVLSTRMGSQFYNDLLSLSLVNVRLMADDLSLKERAISDEKRVPEVKVASIDTLVDLMLEDQMKPIWH